VVAVGQRRRRRLHPKRKKKKEIDPHRNRIRIRFPFGPVYLRRFSGEATGGNGFNGFPTIDFVDNRVCFLDSRGLNEYKTYARDFHSEPSFVDTDQRRNSQYYQTA
jgi:hypothetical protein